MAVVGTLAYAVRSGLGLLAKRFYDKGIVNRVLLMEHPSYERTDWYRNDPHAYTLHQSGSFLNGLDTLLIFENAFNNWQVVDKAKKQGCKIVLMAMHEYTPTDLPVLPDLVLCPSVLELAWCVESIKYTVAAACLNVPVEVEWRLRERALTFVHNAGHGGRDNRNGTREVLEAMQHVKSPLKLLVRGQPDSKQMQLLHRTWLTGGKDSRVEFLLENLPDEDLWKQGDVFVFPEGYNGLSLPLQEACAAGMLCMCGNRLPMNLWLPKGPLIPVKEYVRDRVSSGHAEFERARFDPQTIAATMDTWYGRNIVEFSLAGKKWAQDNSWQKLLPAYKMVLSK